MQYTLISNGISYDLPPYTLEISDKMDKINEQNINQSVNKKVKYISMIDFIVSLLGEDATVDIIGSTDVASVDLQAVAVAYMDICRTYDTPLREARKEESNEAFNSDEMKMVLEILKNADNIEKLKKAAAPSGNQRFTR